VDGQPIPNLFREQSGANTAGPIKIPARNNINLDSSVVLFEITSQFRQVSGGAPGVIRIKIFAKNGDFHGGN
jgi:hypothetical protein